MTVELIQLRRDTATNWATENPVLEQGEPGFDLTNFILKIGDGVTAWNDLTHSFLAGGDDDIAAFIASGDSGTAVDARIIAKLGVDTGWVPVSLGPGITTGTGTAVFAARVLNGILFLRGNAIKGSNFATSDVIGTLDPSTRNIDGIWNAQIMTTTGLIAELKVDGATGIITIFSAPATAFSQGVVVGSHPAV